LLRLRLGAGLIDREADDDRDENSKQRYIGLSQLPSLLIW